MKNNYFKEILLAVILVLFAILLINPFMFWMPTAITMMAVALFAALFFAFASLIWKERAADERENLHRLAAGRIGFLTGSGFLVIAIIAQSFSHHVDPWLVAALTAMIVAKVCALIFGDRIN
jgi:cobalamin synthase